MAKITTDICKNHKNRGKITASIHTPKRYVMSTCAYIVTGINIYHWKSSAWSARFWSAKFWRWGALTNVYWLTLRSSPESPVTDRYRIVSSKNFGNRSRLENQNVEWLHIFYDFHDFPLVSSNFITARCLVRK